MDPITQQGIAGAAGAAGDPVYVDDIFSIDLFRNNNNSAQINNDIDLAGEGGLVLMKYRDANSEWAWVDSERGVSQSLDSQGTNPQYTKAFVNSFDSDGFTHGSYVGTSNSSSIVSYTLRKQKGFFDVVTFTGTGSVQNISHSLGSVPGMIIVKKTSGTGAWNVYHRSLGANGVMYLHDTYGNSVDNGVWNNTAPTSSVFTVGANVGVNANGSTYVAYVFAHDDQQFGENGNEAAIYCGIFNGGGSYQNNIISVNCGFEPQWIMWKRKDSTSYWYVMDVTRKMANDGFNSAAIYFNLNSSEGNPNRFWPYENGFQFDEDLGGASSDYIFVAIARPNKPPETGTEVFDVGSRSGSGSDANTNSSIYTDMTFVLRTDSSTEYNGIASRLGGQYSLATSNTGTSTGGWLDSTEPWATMTGAIINGGNGAGNTGNLIDYSFKRAPGYFDVVTFKGNGSLRNISHNLRAVPQMIWIKNRNASYNWHVYNSVSGASNLMYLDTAHTDMTTSVWNNTAPTSTQFTVNSASEVNQTNYKFIAYLFGSVPGVSKIGGYTGTGGNINIDCGFTSGARFVLIKRRDTGASGGAWHVFSTVGGIYVSHEYHMYLNGTDATVLADNIDPYSAGFTVTSTASAPINQSGGTYLYMAIA